MNGGNICLDQFPEWYRLERESEKTINKLSRLEELRFYLRNPDQHIRRLGILRIQQLKGKDFINVLEEILDDPSESKINKELAAWTIKSICTKWNLELFISHRIIYQFTGNEKYDDLYNICLEDDLSSFQFFLSPSPISSQLGLENRPYGQSTQDLSFNSHFFFQEWLQAWYGEFVSTGRQQLFDLPRKLFLWMQKSVTKWFRERSGKREHFSGGQFRRIFPRSDQRVFLRLFSYIGGAVYRVFYLICFPVRWIIRHKAYTLAGVLASYYLLAFTRPGQIWMSDHFGVSLLEMQKRYLDLDLRETHGEIYLALRKVFTLGWFLLKDIAEWIYNEWMKNIVK